MRASTICSLVQSLSKCHRHGTWCFQYISNYWLDTWGPTKITRLETRMLLQRNNRFEMTVLNRDPIVYWHPALVSESTKLMLNKVQVNYEESTPSNLRRTFSWSPRASLVKALKVFLWARQKSHIMTATYHLDLLCAMASCSKTGNWITHGTLQTLKGWVMREKKSNLDVGNVPRGWVYRQAYDFGTAACFTCYFHWSVRFQLISP